jgi:hypothetical protein
MYSTAVEPLQGFEHMSVVLPKQPLRYMQPVVRVDADQVGVEGRVMFDWCANGQQLNCQTRTSSI